MNNLDAMPKASEKGKIKLETLMRFDILQRIEHIVMLTSFTILAITGLPQRFPNSPLSESVLRIFGGIETARQIHHVSAIILGTVSIFHVLDLLYRVYVLRIPITILPLIEDLKHLYQDILYYLGLRKHKAYYGRYNYAEKAEYLAVVWGILIMGLTGFFMWNPITTSRWLPGQIIPAAKAAHGGEAILAVLAVVVWHFYHVHLRHFNRSMFTGQISRQDMEEEHPAELAQIEAGEEWHRPPKEDIQRRRRIFFPIALVLSLASAFFLFKFVTIETTALTTVPKGETVAVFVPLTPTPRPTPSPVPTPEPKDGVLTESWKGNYEALFRNRCGSCHGRTSVGGLTLATYQDTLRGGNSGAAVVPGDPDASLLVQVQSIGNHPGQLTIEELNDVIEWIMAGAIEE
jgi:cytochrome b subunit of formate dehydrogenase